MQKRRLRQGFRQNRARASYSWSPVPGHTGFGSSHWILWAKPNLSQTCPTWGLFLGSQKQAFLASWLWALIVYINVMNLLDLDTLKKNNNLIHHPPPTKWKRTKTSPRWIPSKSDLCLSSKSPRSWCEAVILEVKIWRCLFRVSSYCKWWLSSISMLVYWKVSLVSILICIY